MDITKNIPLFKALNHVTWLGKLDRNSCMKPLTSFVMQYLWGIIQILLQSNRKMSFMPLNAVKLNRFVETWW